MRTSCQLIRSSLKLLCNSPRRIAQMSKKLLLQRAHPKIRMHYNQCSNPWILSRVGMRFKQQVGPRTDHFNLEIFPGQGERKKIVLLVDEALVTAHRSFGILERCQYFERLLTVCYPIGSRRVQTLQLPHDGAN